MAAEVLIEEEQCSGEIGANGAYTHPNAEEVDYIAVSAAIGEQAGDPAGMIKASPIAANIGSTRNHKPIGESGDMDINSDWLTINLQNYYFHPVVIAGVPTMRGGDAVAVRIRNVRHGHGCPGWCFDIRLQEPGTDTFLPLPYLTSHRIITVTFVAQAASTKRTRKLKESIIWSWKVAATQRTKTVVCSKLAGWKLRVMRG
jgi:hypothetical protein